MMAMIPTNHISAMMIRASSGPGSLRKVEKEPKKTVSSPWWGPLFGMSTDSDHMYPGSSTDRDSVPDKVEMSGLGRDPDRSVNRYALGCFTEEKARQLRRKTAEGSSFHDLMYHSAIASRLASDAPVQAEK